MHTQLGPVRTRRTVLGAIVVAAMLSPAACGPSDETFPAPSARCRRLSSAFTGAKAEWEADRGSDQARASMKRTQGELLDSGCLHS